LRSIRRDLFSTMGFFGLLVVAPQLLSNEYYLSTLIISMIHAIVVVGLNLLMGYAGQISLGHAAFYGLAAYASSILSVTYGVPLWGAIAIALAVVAVVAYLIGIPTLKLKGHYLAMATLGFGIIVYIVFNETVSITGGPTGFVGLMKPEGFVSIPKLSLFGYELKSDISFYYATSVVLAIAVLVSLNIISSRVGRALRAIHTSETASQVVGIDISKYKLFIFILSAVYAAVGGVLYAHYMTFVAPSSFGFKFSIELVTMVVLGGMASVWGAVFGAFFLTLLPEFLRAFENLEILLYGAILIACMMFLPDGLAGGLRRLMAFLRRRRSDGGVSADGS
jgi:branched-chain amino acid transport system permease protein